MIFGISSTFSLLESSAKIAWKVFDSRSIRIGLSLRALTFHLVAGRRGPSPPPFNPYKRIPGVSSTRRHLRLRLSSSVAP